jgi:hypothetical protein
MRQMIGGEGMEGKKSLFFKFLKFEICGTVELLG